MSTTITKSVADRVYSIFELDNAGGLLDVTGRAFSMPSKPATTYEWDLVEFGMIFGICFSLCRDEDAWEDHKAAAERALQHARVVQARWGGPVSARPDDSDIAAAASRLVERLNDLEPELYKRHRPIYEALTELTGAIDGPKGGE